MEKYLLYLGRLEAKKNIANLLEAFKILKEKYKIPHKLYLAGERGTACPEIKDKDIVELGWVGDTYSLMKKAEIFVFPTNYEGFGLPILEAFMAKRPVACSDLEVLHEVGGDACLYFDQKNPAEMAEKIYQLLNNPDLQKFLIQKGQERLKLFSWQKCAQETWQIISTVLK